MNGVKMNTVLCCCLLLVISFIATSAQNFTVNCRENRGSRISDRNEELNCCNQTFADFSRTWHNEADYITEMMETLSDWNCSQFATECSKPTFNFNSFTGMVYKRTCNRSAFEDDCRTPLLKASSSRGGASVLWSDFL
uniref:Folate receptor-like domain-containing protein n=1 Tax=Ciona savignyi TaxID=51511 RepID=H2ZK73_CIOSA